MLSCKELVKTAPEHLEGQVSFLKRMEILMHLAMCHHCRRYFRQLKRAIDFVRPQFLKKKPPEGMQEKLLVELAQKQQKADAPGREN